MKKPKIRTVHKVYAQSWNATVTRCAQVLRLSDTSADFSNSNGLTYSHHSCTINTSSRTQIPTTIRLFIIFIYNKAISVCRKLFKIGCWRNTETNAFLLLFLFCFTNIAVLKHFLSFWKKNYSFFFRFLFWQNW